MVKVKVTFSELHHRDTTVRRCRGSISSLVSSNKNNNESTSSFKFLQRNLRHENVVKQIRHELDFSDTSKRCDYYRHMLVLHIV